MFDSPKEFWCFSESLGNQSFQENFQSLEFSRTFSPTSSSISAVGHSSGEFFTGIQEISETWVFEHKGLPASIPGADPGAETQTFIHRAWGKEHYRPSKSETVKSPIFPADFVKTVRTIPVCCS